MPGRKKRAATGQLGLFRARPPGQQQPRGNDGRFVALRYSPQRLLILRVARQMRRDMGLPPMTPEQAAVLDPFGEDLR